MATTFDDKKIIYTMDRVSRTYGTKTVLKDISISYYYGAKIGVIGENGSGKSSLILSTDKDLNQLIKCVNDIHIIQYSPVSNKLYVVATAVL